MKQVARIVCCLSAAFGGFLGLSSASAAEKVTARSYEGHDDLIAQWDGIENAGYGLPHDASATVWKDLVGNLDITIMNGAAFVDGKALGRTSGSGIMGQASGKCATNLTLEICCDWSSSFQKGCALLFQDGSRVLGMRTTGVNYIQHSTAGHYVVSGQTATYALTFAGNTVAAADAGYENGESCEAWSKSDGWGSSSALMLGYSKGTYPYSGKIYAIRLYNRKLTPEELARNRTIDVARFFDPSALLDFEVGAIPEQGFDGFHPVEPELRLTDKETGDDLVRGVDYTVAYENNEAPGTGRANITGLGKYEGQDTYKDFTIVRRGYGGPHTASSYRQTGLIAQYDAIENVGRGLAHDGTATEWSDLCGGDPYVLANAGAWGADEISFASSGESSALGSSLRSGKTIEVCFRMAAAPTGGFMLWATGSSGQRVYPCIGYDNAASPGTVMVGGYRTVPFDSYTEVNTVLAAYGSDGYASAAATNGIPADITADGSYYTYGVKSGSVIGGWSNCKALGSVYAIRVYDRELTAAEIELNAALDRARFGGDLSKLPQFFIEPIPVQSGDGVHEVRPAVTVRDAILDVGLTKDVDYSVAYADNIAGGVDTAKVTVTGIGKYAGKGGATATFTIRAATFVAPTASGAADGSSWANAKDLATALAEAEENEPLALKEGLYDLSSGGVTVGRPVTIRGGYAGDDGDLMRREPGALSTLDGGDAADFLMNVTADVSSGAPVLVERLLFSRAATNALVKAGGAGLELESCLFASNGLTAFRCTGAATVRACRFMANRSASADGVVLMRGSGASSFVNCLFAGNELGKAGGLVTLKEAERYQTPSVDFDRCTFACNLGAQAASVCGILAVNGRANVRNSIFGTGVFSAAHAGAKHVLVKSGARVDVDYTLFPAGSEADAALAEAGGTLQLGEAVRFRAADFRTPPEAFAALVTQDEGGLPVLDPARLNEVFDLDFHVRNSDGFYSAAIDTGDPETPVGDEPAPNGGRVNLGFYGGTAEAATSAAGAPTADVSVVFPNGLSVPRVTVAYGGGLYNADVRILCATGGLDWIEVAAFPCVRNGETSVADVAWVMVPGDTCKVRAVLSAGGRDDVSVDWSGPVEGRIPDWFGRGGDPETTIHVWADAILEPDGRSWGTAYRTLAEAFAACDATKSEIWIAGDQAPDANLTFEPKFAVTVRGGFTGVEDSASERREGAVGVLDGRGQRTCILTVNAAVPVTLERLRIAHAYKIGLAKTGAGDFTLEGCAVDDCGRKDDGYSGRGANLTGGGAARLRISNCRFAGNQTQGYSNQRYEGGALYVASFASATIEDTAFETNGVAITASTRYFMRQFLGVAIYDNSVPLALRRCTFRGHRSNCDLDNGSDRGGIVVLAGAGIDGSTVENCAFVGNEDIYLRNNLPAGADVTTNTGRKAGALVIDAADAAVRVDVRNCTFSHNVSDAIGSAGALSVVGGAVTVENCLFHRNLRCRHPEATGGRDIAVSSNATLNLSYTMFDEDARTNFQACVTGLDYATVAEKTLVFGDPLFLQDAELSDLVATGDRIIFNQTAETEAALMAIDVHETHRSPAVDAGDPASDYRREPKPHGFRINLGCYGNTSEAALGKVGFVLIVR